MSLLHRLYLSFYPPTPPKDAHPLRIGILGAANIAPVALCIPARSHPGVELAVVGARSKEKAEKFAKQNGVKRAVQGYDAVLQDEGVDAVYNPLPNGLHYEWTMKALAAGKHVLLEKPATNTVAETERIFALAKEKGLVVLEAFHYRFHPSVQRLKAIVTSGELGTITHITAHLAVPRGFIGAADIRFQYALGGGAAMDMGCYVGSVCRYIAGAEPTEVVSATPTLLDKEKEPKVDRRMEFVCSFPAAPSESASAQPGTITAECMCDLGMPWRGPFGLVPRLLPDIMVKVVGTEGEAEMGNFVMPTLYHWITVKSKKGKRTEKVYVEKEGKGETWWSTYRFQLEAFVDKIQGREPQHWVTPEDSVGNMRLVNMVYEKSGLGVRPESEFKL